MTATHALPRSTQHEMKLILLCYLKCIQREAPSYIRILTCAAALHDSEAIHQKETIMPRNYDDARGERHGAALYTDEQVARAKRLLIEAEHITVLAKGEIARIAELTGITPRTLASIHLGERWQHLPPAPSTATDN